MPFHILNEKVISRVGGGADFAAIDHGNILAVSPGTPWMGRRVFWSGWMGDSVASLDFRTWSKEAWRLLDQWCDGLAPQLSASHGVACFRPHPRHVLSDPQSCATFLKRRIGQPFEVLLDPAGFLTPAMLSRAEDHLRRALDALAEHDSVSGIVIANVQRLDDDLLQPCRADAGALAPDLVRLIHSRVPEGKAAILIPPGVEEQIRFLHAAAPESR